MALSKSYFLQYGIRSINLIVPNAYGPGDSCDPNKTHAMNGIIIRLIKARKNKDTTFLVWGTGKPIREWVFVEDIARVFRIAIEKFDNLIEPVNIGQDNGFSINQSVNEVIKQLKFEIDIEHDLSLSDGAPKKVMSSVKFNANFPNFKFTSIEKGIEKTIEYYAEKL